MLWKAVQEAVDQLVGSPEGLLANITHVVDLPRKGPVLHGGGAEWDALVQHFFQKKADLPDVLAVGFVVARAVRTATCGLARGTFQYCSIGLVFQF